MVDTLYTDQLLYTLPIRAVTTDGYVLYLGRLRAVPELEDGFVTEVFNRIEAGVTIPQRYSSREFQPFIDLPLLNNASPDIYALRFNKRVDTRSFGGRFTRRGTIKQAVNAAKVAPNQGHLVLADQPDSRFSIIDVNTGLYTPLNRVNTGGTITAADFSQGAGGAWVVDPSLVSTTNPVPYDLDFPEPASNKTAIGTTNLGRLAFLIPIVTELGRIIYIQLDRTTRIGGGSSKLLTASNTENVRMGIESDEGDCDRGIKLWWENATNLVLDECAA